MVGDAGDVRRDREFEWKVGRQKITKCIRHLKRHQFEFSLISGSMSVPGTPRCNRWQRSNNTFRRLVTTLVWSARQTRIPTASSSWAWLWTSSTGTTRQISRIPRRPATSQHTSGQVTGSSSVQAQKASGHMTSGQPKIKKRSPTVASRASPSPRLGLRRLQSV